MAEVENIDFTDSTLLHSGKVIYMGISHRLLMMQKGLRLTTSKEGSNADELVDVLFDLSWRDVVCACKTTVKKTKAQTKSKPGLDDSNQGNMFALYYMVKDKKTKKKQCKNFVLEAAEGLAEEWISQIKEKCKEGKPQKLLIIINSVGGKGRAQQMFEKHALPLFALAGVELVVKVTERKNHAIEIAKTFDVSSVDGVISMGGDGLYMEILHGLTLCKQEEEGVKFNDSDAKLVPPTVCVGIIPAGTGNGVAASLYGVADMDTAVLNIIRGDTNRINIFSIHAQGKLVHYAGLLFGNGFFSNLIKKSDGLRWMKTARYPYAIMSRLFQKEKIMEFNIEVLKKDDTQQNKKEEAGDRGDKAAAKITTVAWKKLGTKQLTAAIGFAAKIRKGPVFFNLDLLHPAFDLLILETASRLEYVKSIFGLFSRKKEVLERQFVQCISDILGVKFELSLKEKADASSSSWQAQIELPALNLDGEVVSLPESKFEIRLHHNFLQMFCDKDCFSMMKTTEG